MPFTPIHMGPGILIKSILQGSFSLMVFGWTQIAMDIQPFIVLISVSMLHKVCLYSGLVGAAIYYGINWRLKGKVK